MQDTFGASLLMNIRITEDEVRFIKKYEQRADHIHYTFAKKDRNSWIGEFTGERCGTGISRCVITEVPEEFFDPRALMQALGRDTAHQWPPGTPEF